MVNSFMFVIIITLAQLPGYFSAAFLVERLGRKPVIVAYLLSSALCAYMLGTSTTTPTILVWASLMSFFNLGAWGAVYTYTPEQYPTSFRGSGTGAAAACGRVGGLIAPMLVGATLPSLGQQGVLALNAGLLVLASLSVLVLGKETRGRTLEELSK